MKTLEMSITPDYVPHWDTSAALREFLQNALDSQRDGNLLEISTNEEAVLLTNYGASLPLKTLLLGSTTKANDDNSIGQFGEGYKLGCLVLAREGIKMSISSPIGTLYPVIAESKNYQTKVLSFNIDEGKKFLPGVQLSFSKPITEKWLKALILLEDPYTPRVLKDRPGMVYLNGLQINLEKPTKTEDHWHWGYNLPPTLKLDRDRMMVSPYDLMNHIADVIFETETVDNIYTALVAPIPEISELAVYNIPRGKEDQIRDKFISLNGEKAYGISSMFSDTKSEVVRDAGLTPIKLQSKQLLVVLERKQKSWDEVQEEAKWKLHSFKETKLDPKQEETFSLVKRAIESTLPDLPEVIPVIFPQENLRGVSINGNIYLSIKTFTTTGELAATIIHEYLHNEFKGHDKYFWQAFENKISEVLTSLIGERYLV